MYCQSEIEGHKACKEQCDHCKQYYRPLEGKHSLEEYGVTPEDMVWVLLCRGKITVEQALKFHIKEVTIEDLIKATQKD